jgi:hypothetical protein
MPDEPAPPAAPPSPASPPPTPDLTLSGDPPLVVPPLPSAAPAAAPAAVPAVVAPAAVVAVDPMAVNMQVARMIAAAFHGGLGALALLIGIGWAFVPLGLFALECLSLLGSLTYLFEDPSFITYLISDVIGMFIRTGILLLPSLLAVPMGALGLATAGALFKRHPAQLVLGLLTIPQCLFLGILGWPLIGLTMAVLFHPSAKIDPSAPAVPA